MKRKIAAILTSLTLAAALAACGSAGSSDISAVNAATAEDPEEDAINNSSTSDGASVSSHSDEKRVASDGAEIQMEDTSVSTRIPPENGTKVNIRFDDEAVITGVLNDSETAQALIAKLPYTVHMNRYSHDFCGVTDDLPYNEDEVHYGWLNGDIDYAIDAPYFTILFKDEDISEQFGYQVNIGVVTSPLSDLDQLEGGYDVTIELAE